MSNTSTCLPPTSSHGTDISSSIDGMYYGFVLATFFGGITVVQGWTYIHTNEDKWPLRILVMSIVLMDLGTTILQSQGVHHYLVANFGNLQELMVFTHILNAEFALTTVVKFIAEMFFASVVLKLRPKKYLVPGLIVITAIGAFAAGFVTVASQATDSSVHDLGERSRKIQASLHDAFAAASNIIATVALSISFFKSRTGIKRTDNILQTLFLFVVTRGVFLAVAQLFTLILYVVYPERLYWLALCLCHSKFYAITMLAMLNARPTLRAKLETVLIDSSLFIAALESSSNGPSSGQVSNPSAPSIKWNANVKREDGHRVGIP